MKLNIIETILSPLAIPVSYHTYEGTSETYITYERDDEGESLAASNQEIGTYTTVQINLLTLHDFEDMLEDIKRLMRENEWYRQNGYFENRDSEGWFQISMRFKKNIINL